MENEETAIMKSGGKPILNLELLWSFRECVNMLFKCPLKNLSIKRIFQWYIYVASKASQLSVGYVNMPFECLLITDSKQIIGKLSNGRFL